MLPASSITRRHTAKTFLWPLEFHIILDTLAIQAQEIVSTCSIEALCALTWVIHKTIQCIKGLVRTHQQLRKGNLAQTLTQAASELLLHLPFSLLPVNPLKLV